jgi:hypothetical protein
MRDQRKSAVACAPEYKAWRGAINACSSPNGRLAAKRIKVCRLWRGDFHTFLRDVGHRPSPAHRLTRIDASVDYQPGNVVWKTGSPSGKHSLTRLVVHDGRTQSLSKWAEELGIAYHTLYARMRAGKTLLGSGKERKRHSRLPRLLFNYFGEELSLLEISRRTGIGYFALYRRIKQGESLQQALNQSINRRRMPRPR